MHGKSSFRQSFSSHVGIGSKSHDLEAHLFIKSAPNRGDFMLSDRFRRRRLPPPLAAAAACRRRRLISDGSHSKTVRSSAAIFYRMYLQAWGIVLITILSSSGKF